MRTLIIALLLTTTAKAEYYAFVNPSTRIVEQVIVADRDFINHQPNAIRWLRTCIDPSEGCGIKNFAGIGYTHNTTIPAYVAPQPFPSWVLDANGIWQAPIPPPDASGNWVWDEATQSWLPVAN